MKTLRTRVIITVGATLVLLMFAVFATSRIILSNSFADLEEREVIEGLQREQAALSDEISRLNSVAGDWAPWDDTYNFIEDGNETYIQSNMTDDTLANLRVEFMLFVDLSGRLVYSKTCDFDNMTAGAVPKGLLEHLSTQPPPACLGCTNHPG